MGVSMYEYIEEYAERAHMKYLTHGAPMMNSFEEEVEFLWDEMTDLLRGEEI